MRMVKYGILVNLNLFFLIQVTWQLVAQAVDVGFDSAPVNMTVIKGHPAMLKCTVQNKQDKQIIWMNPKLVLISTEDRRVIDDTRLSIERPFVNRWDLHIRSVHVDDDGVYLCQINTDPIQIKRIRLTVLVPAEINNGTSSDTRVVIKEGDQVELQCIASGIPPPTVNWFRRTPHSSAAREAVGTAGEILRIHNITRYCGGTYECEASNNIAQPAKRIMDVQVYFKPEVTLRNKRILQSVGKETVLECLVAANPKSSVLWKKGNEVVGEPGNSKWPNFRTTIYNEDTFTLTLSLAIINLNQDDFDSYTCEAANQLGDDRDTMVLAEIKIQTAPPPTRPSIDYDTWQGGANERVYETYYGNDVNTGSRHYNKGNSDTHISGQGLLGIAETRMNGSSSRTYSSVQTLVLIVLQVYMCTFLSN